VFALFLIAAGTVILLNTLGVLEWSIWLNLWRFWPVFLILIGVGLLFRHGRPVIMSIVAVVALAAVISLAWAITDGRILAGELVTSQFNQEQTGATRLDLDINFGAGELTVGSLPTDDTDLVKATFMDREDGVQTTSRRIGDVQSVSFDVREGGGWWFVGSRGREWDVMVREGLATELTIDGGAGSFILDLEDLRVTDFTINHGASSLEVTVPAAAGQVTGQIRGGASSIEVTIPVGVAARIRNSTGASSVDIDQDRFPRSGDVHQSPGYATAVNRIDLEISAGVSSVTVR
jgi:hypothetical protein